MNSIAKISEKFHFGALSFWIGLLYLVCIFVLLALFFFMDDMPRFVILIWLKPIYFVTDLGPYIWIIVPLLGVLGLRSSEKKKAVIGIWFGFLGIACFLVLSWLLKMFE